MKIEKSFTLPRSRDAVWGAFNDIRLVAACLPGASISEDLGGGRYKGLFSLKLGPMAAAFAGEVSIAPDPETWTAVITGKGADARSSSRATGSMTYRLLEAETAASTQVAVTSEINLAGSLAQFGKAAVVQEVANRITAEFVRNFEARLGPPVEAVGTKLASDAQPASPPQSPVQPLDAGNLIWVILRDRIRGFFDRLFGRNR